MRRSWLVGLVVVLGLVAGGCAGDDGGSASPTTAPSTSTTVGSGSGSSTSSTATSEPPADEATTTTTAPGADPCPANTNPQAADTVMPRAELVAVRAAHQPGFDRVVFEFRGAAPGFRVEYGNKPVTQDGSGDEVPLQGRYALYVRMDNATSWHFDDDGDAVEESGPSYTGPKRIRPGGTTVVRELVQSGDFEGVLNWAIGVDTKVGFRVRKLANPPRLMIELCAKP